MTDQPTPAVPDTTPLAALRARLVERRDHAVRSAQTSTLEEARLVNDGVVAGLDEALHFLDAIEKQRQAGPNLSPGYVNPPGSTVEQLPADLLALIDVPPYLSTACDTAGRLAAVEADQAAEWAARLHQRCRLNNKFTGAPCPCTCHA